MDVRANGITIHAEISGPADAPVLVCLHSLATDGEVWDRQLGAFEDHFRVVRPDFRGHGATEVTPPPYSLDLLRDDLIGLLDSLEIERVAIVGVSLGGIVAIGTALAVPARVERILVADCRADAPDAYVAMWDASIANAREHGMAPVIETSLQRWFTEPFRARNPELIDRVRARALATDVEGFVGCARAVQGLSYRSRLNELAVPVRYVVGSEDPAAPVDVMRTMADLTPGGKLEVIEGAGHLTPLEAGDAFTEIALEFLVGP
jgi:3-oxoadipate enol-lactonase